MKSLIVLVALVASVALAMPTAVEFETWRVQHGKSYTTRAEKHRRQQIWEENKQFVQQHNEAGNTYTVGMNIFADMTNAEFRLMFLGTIVNLNATRSGSTYLPAQNVQLPASMDWRKNGIVTAVKDQGQCGSCWAFSTTGSLEGQHALKTGSLVSLSEQNLVDCSGKYGNEGCDGGLMDSAFEYIQANKGIDTESSYPYTAKDGTCKFSAANVGATVSGYTDIKSGSETDLQTAVGTVGPVAVAIDASHNSFQLYTSGVYNEKSCSATLLDHGVLAVGYDTDAKGGDYWIVKNSWGTSWGQAGYLWMSRNKSNQCGIATAASYPLV